MSSGRSIVSWGVRGALLAAVASVLAGVFAAVFPGRNMGPEGSLSWFLIESSDAVAEVGLIAALVALHVRQAPQAGRLGRAGVVLTVAGTVLLVVSTVMWLLPLTDGVLLDVLFNGALLLWLVGFPVLGIATLRAGVLRRWCGYLLLGFVPFFATLFVLVDYWGEVRALLALMWLALAAALRTDLRAVADVGNRIDATPPAGHAAEV